MKRGSSMQDNGWVSAASYRIVSVMVFSCKLIHFVRKKFMQSLWHRKSPAIISVHLFPSVPRILHIICSFSSLFVFFHTEFCLSWVTTKRRHLSLFVLRALPQVKHYSLYLTGCGIKERVFGALLFGSVEGPASNRMPFCFANFFFFWSIVLLFVCLARHCVSYRIPIQKVTQRLKLILKSEWDIIFSVNYGI